jgi:hypothetical protein
LARKHSWGVDTQDPSKWEEYIQSKQETREWFLFEAHNVL